MWSDGKGRGSVCVNCMWEPRGDLYVYVAQQERHLPIEKYRLYG